jgi:hypothetical protein
MQYNKEHNLLFIHIPKTAGRFIEQKLSYIFYNNLDLYGGHTKLLHYYKPDNYNIFKDFITFCVVRNPYDRVYSAYKYLEKRFNEENDNQDKMYWRWLNKPSNFSEFINNLDGVYKSNDLYNFIHLIKQKDFCFYKNYKVKHILKFENLKDDFYTFINIYKNTDLYQKLYSNIYENIKCVDTYIDNYNVEQIKIINKIYSDDFDIFNYKKL